MNKILLYIATGSLILLVIFFFLWRGEMKNSAILQSNLNTAQQQIIQLNSYNEVKDKELKKIQVKYNSVITSYVGTDCENQPVSKEMINALKSIGENNEQNKKY